MNPTPHPPILLEYGGSFEAKHSCWPYQQEEEGYRRQVQEGIIQHEYAAADHSRNQNSCTMKISETRCMSSPLACTDRGFDTRDEAFEYFQQYYLHTKREEGITKMNNNALPKASNLNNPSPLLRRNLHQRTGS